MVLATEDPTERKVRFLALLATELPKARRPVLAGGSAIEVYLDGMLRTGDMDIVYPAKELEVVLKRWRFALGGGLRAWVNDELRLAVDMVGGELDGSRERLTTITTPFGPATIMGVEDLILKRLASAKFWRVPTDVEQSYLLAKAYEDEIDWEYLEEAADKEAVTDYLRKLRELLSEGAKPKHHRGEVRGGSRAGPGRSSMRPADRSGSQGP